MNYDLVDLMTSAQSDTPSESCKRMVCAALLTVTHMACQKNRLKKPFNPILHETYEYITQGYRFFAEQVSHHPPITAFHIEGQGFELFSHSGVVQAFKFGGGTGSLTY